MSILEMETRKPRHGIRTMKPLWHYPLFAASVNNWQRIGCRGIFYTNQLGG